MLELWPGDFGNLKNYGEILMTWSHKIFSQQKCEDFLLVWMLAFDLFGCHIKFRATKFMKLRLEFKIYLVTSPCL